MNSDAIRAIEQDKLPKLYRLGEKLILASWETMKIVPAEFIVRRALADGHLAPGGLIVESTSGNFGLGLARAAVGYGCSFCLVGDRAIDPTLRARFDLLGARIELAQPDADGSYQKPRLRRLHELRRSLPGSFWPCQYDNPGNAEAYEAIADYIQGQLGVAQIDQVVSPHGSGGSGAGITRRLRERRHPARLVAVDTPGSVLFGCADRPRRLRGLGNSILPTNVRHDFVDEVHWIPACLAFAAAVSLYSDIALDLGPTSGAAVLAALDVAARRPNDTLLVICPDRGERYRHDVLSPAWLAENGLTADPKTAAPRVVTDPSYVRDEWARMDWGRRRIDQVLAVRAAGAT